MRSLRVFGNLDAGPAEDAGRSARCPAGSKQGDSLWNRRMSRMNLMMWSAGSPRQARVLQVRQRAPCSSPVFVATYRRIFPMARAMLALPWTTMRGAWLRSERIDATRHAMQRVDGGDASKRAMCFAIRRFLVAMAQSLVLATRRLRLASTGGDVASASVSLQALGTSNSGPAHRPGRAAVEARQQLPGRNRRRWPLEGPHALTRDLDSEVVCWRMLSRWRSIPSGPVHRPRCASSLLSNVSAGTSEGSGRSRLTMIALQRSPARAGVPSP